MSEAIVLLEDEILELEGINDARNDWINYKYGDKEYGVPRVSHILAQCRNSEGLIQWAANIGRRKYDYYRNKALEIGTEVHELIDEYLMNNFVHHIHFEVDYETICYDYRDSVFNSINNFDLWVKRLEKMGASIEEIVGLEVKVSCPWYGGTIDGILKINGLYYIVDFKTSKSISPEYLLQTAAYMWIINNGYAPELPHIDGIGIIRVDKTRFGVIDDVFLTEMNPAHKSIIDGYQNCFASYINAFYRTINTDFVYNKYYKSYNPKNIFEVN